MYSNDFWNSTQHFKYGYFSTKALNFPLDSSRLFCEVSKEGILYVCFRKKRCSVLCAFICILEFDEIHYTQPTCALVHCFLLLFSLFWIYTVAFMCWLSQRFWEILSSYWTSTAASYCPLTYPSVNPFAYIS